MAADNVRVQINFKTPRGTLVNVYAETNEEAEALALALPYEAIAEAEGTLAAGSAVAPLVAPQIPQQFTPAAAPAAAPAGGKTCAHGEMTYREGQSARGPWKGYFCPTPKGTPGQCKAEFLR